jgi:hypothetical protein
MDITDVDQFMLAEEQETEIEELNAENEELNDDFEMTTSQYEELEGMLDEYSIDTQNLYEEADNKDLVEIMNDDGSMFTAEQLGISLGLAEEIERENLFRYIDLLTSQCKKVLAAEQQQSEREVPKGSTLVNIRDKQERKRTKFDKYIDQIIAEDKGKIPT